MKIAICGSMTASKEMLALREELVKQNHIVILPEFAEDYAKLDSMDEVVKESAHNKIEHDLIKGYYETIRDCDAVLIANVQKNNFPGYIGGNTFLEMGFAHVLDKKIFVLNDLPTVSYSDEIEAMQPIVINGDLELIK